MNKYSNILKIPRITHHSEELIKKIERKIIDHKNVNESIINEIKRDDIECCYIEFPKKIIIEPDFKRINYEKFVSKDSKNENQSIINL